MQKAGLAGVCAFLCLVGCGKDRRAPGGEGAAGPGSAAGPPGSSTAAQPSPEVSRVDIGDGKTMWIDPLRYRNLALLPVTIAPAEVDPTDYLTLDEGMKAKQVEIAEVSSEGTVNSLKMTNRSERPLFALAGEVVIGGKQDRIIGKSTIVSAAEQIDVPVFCVEQGRWSGRKADFSSAESIAHLKLRNVADYGDQGEVWQEVSVKNASRGESNDTGTYRDVALKKGAVEEYKEAIDAAYEKKYSSRQIAGEPIVGFAVAYNGQIVGIEAFRSPTLFAKLRGKLLHSYYVEAIDREYDQAASDAPMAAEAVEKAKSYKRKYSAEDGDSEDVYGNASSATTSWSNAKVKGTEVRRKSAGKKVAKPVYESAEMH